MVTGGGSRLYDDAAVARLERIVQLKELMNFTLEEVRLAVEFDDQLAVLKELAEPHRVSKRFSQELIDTASTSSTELDRRTIIALGMP